jgi:hypothetical protein
MQRRTCSSRPPWAGHRSLLLLLALLVAALVGGGDAKGTGGGGGGGRAGRASYGGGGTISRGYTRTYFFVYAGTRHRCSSCSRTTERDSMSPEMRAVAVLAEFDVTFPAGTDLGSEAVPSQARLAAEPYIEARVATIVSRSVATVTQEDVTVRDSWRAPATCSGTASDGRTCDLDGATDGTAECPPGCDYDDTPTVMYEVTIFSGEAGPGDVSEAGVISPSAVGAQVFNALRICGDCGALGAGSATANGGATCAAEELVVVADTRLADCCNKSVSNHVTSFSSDLTSSGAAAGSRISDCGNRTMEVITLTSDVESFGEESSGGGMVVLLVLFSVIVLCCVCKKIGEARERAEKRNRAQHLVQNIGMGQQTWPSDQRQPQQRQHVLQPHTSMQQPPVVMAQFVGHGAPPPTVAEAASKGQAMMGGPLPVAHVMSTQNPAIATTAVSRQVPRQAP